MELSGLAASPGWIDADGDPDYNIDISDYPHVHEWWRDWLTEETSKEYFREMSSKIADSHSELEDLKAIFPPKPQIFKVFEYPEPSVVVLGQGN